MSCELKILISIFILSAVALYINQGYFSTTTDWETAGYSGESGIYRELNNVVETEPLRLVHSGALQLNATKPNLQRIKRAGSKLGVSAVYSNIYHNDDALPQSSRSNVYEFPWRPNDSLSSPLLYQNDPQHYSLTSSSYYRASEIEPGFQSDASAAGFEGPGISGKIYSSQRESHSQATDVWLAIKPMVYCSGDVMTFTADGREYKHILVDRVGASPLPLFQLPAYCGYSVRFTWKDVVLMAPYDGCYIRQENGNYVLSLLWWGSPIKISCPMRQMVTQPTPSVFCSHVGMAIKIEGAQEDVEKHRVKVNGKVLPLLSETCAFRVDSPPEVIIVYTSFSSRCVTVTDRENALVVILDGKQFTLSCPFPHHLAPFHPYLHSHPFHQPLEPNQEQVHVIPHVPGLPAVPDTDKGLGATPKLETSKGPVIPHFPYEPLVPEFHHYHIKQPPASYQSSYPIYQVPMYEHQKPPVIPHLPYEQPLMPQFHHDHIKQPHASVQGTYPVHQLPGIFQHQKPETSKPPVIPHFPYKQPIVPQVYHDHIKQPHDPLQGTYPIHQIPSTYQHQKPSHIYPMFVLPHPAPPVDTPKPFIQQHLSLPGYQIPQTPVTISSAIPPPPIPPAHETATEEMVPQSQYQTPYHPMMPVIYPLQHYSPFSISCPPYPETFCSQYPFLLPHHHPYHHQAAMTTVSQPTIQPIPQTSFSPKPTYKPLTRPVIQKTVLPQLPTFPVVLPSEPPKLSPSLTCTRNKLVAHLPSADMDSIKVKDTSTNTWVSITSAPAACKYEVRSRGRSVVLSSPLPACHSQKLSSSVFSLITRFWDSTQLRYRTLQLQCQHSGETMTKPPKVPPATVKPLHHIIPYLTTVPTPSPHTPKAQILCSSQHMSVTLPPGPTSGLTVEAPSSGIKTQSKAVALLEAPSHCGYSMKRDKNGAINILLPYSSCHMTQEDGQYRIILKYQMLDGRTVESLLSCQAAVSQECDVAVEQQLVCGSEILSAAECLHKGCCFSSDTQSCYYPMDECTVDRHFVFAVHSSVADPPLSPASLVTAGNSSCAPQKITDDFALFKIPLDECGVHRYEVGKAVIYMVEILNMVQSISLNYGTITRDSPVRLLVECRYFPGSVVSVGYLVKSPSLGPSIKAQGVFGVQLRIATDEHYSDFYPQYHQPLRVLLGKPLYLEVRLLNPPDPSAVLLVHYCIAYPRSATSAWVLIYDGCPNFLDQTPTHKPPPPPPEALTNQVRRFTVTTFQFLSEDDNLLADEEIYFMCSTEVCLPSDGPCVEGCFGNPSNVKS